MAPSINDADLIKLYFDKGRKQCVLFPTCQLHVDSEEQSKRSQARKKQKFHASSKPSALLRRPRFQGSLYQEFTWSVRVLGQLLFQLKVLQQSIQNHPIGNYAKSASHRGRWLAIWLTSPTSHPKHCENIFFLWWLLRKTTYDMSYRTKFVRWLMDGGTTTCIM